MNYKKINIISDIYFFLILLLGLSYISFVVFIGEKIIPAFLMQVIFLIDAIKNNHLFDFVFSELFLINTISGIVWLFLIFKIIKSIKISQEKQLLTKKWIERLKSKKINNVFVFKSLEKLIFTSGFFNPKIFISSVLNKTHSQKEMVAMMEHENNHKENFHSSKLILIDFIKRSTLNFPFKKWLFENYKIMIEIASDTRAEEKLLDKKPIVSALIKFSDNNLAFNINGFNSQSERIKILTGKKKWSVKLPMIYLTFIFTILFGTNSLLNNKNIFFECKHLLECAKEMIMSDGKSLLEKSEKNQKIEASSHCKNQLIDMNIN